MVDEIKYSTIATEKEVYLFLKKNNENFYPSLDIQVDLKKYAKKLFDFADFIIAKRHNQIIALCAYYNNSSSKAYLTSIVVEKKFKGRGIGNILIDKMIQKIKNKKICLEVYKDNHIAINLYRNKGFKILYYKDKFAYMEREI